MCRCHFRPRTLIAYSYALNNPLLYNDLSGESFLSVFASFFLYGTYGFYQHSVAQAKGYSGWQSLFYAGGQTAIAGASMVAGAGVGALVSGTFGTLGFTAGALSGAAGGLAGGFIGSAGNAWINGASFGQGLAQGLIGGAYGIVTGGLIGGISAGISAVKYNGDFWSGRGAILESPAASGLNPENVKVGDGMEYTTDYANRVADNTYGELNYASLTTNEVPEGRGFTLKNGCIIGKDGSMTNGLTIYIGSGNSKVFLGKSAFTNYNQLRLTIGHEYIHATQNFMRSIGALTNNINEMVGNVKMAEIAAYNWESTMGVANGYGGWTGYLRGWSWRRLPYYNWLIHAKF